MTDIRPERLAADSGQSRRNRNRVAMDWLLIVAALASALWACMTMLAPAEASFRHTIAFDARSVDAEATWFIDDTNVIHWPSGSADGGTGLALSLTSVPSEVVVLVHPDSLVEPLVRAIDVLHKAGARRVHVAVSGTSPFSNGEQEKLP